ncbi:MAG: hypothetical protein QXP97_06785 [Desulfurococcus sp.]|uniref:hypothetical protein n=1 Tax=Desulfurococcus sp. TaxID=51678 RepID=UPI00316A6ADF
MDNRKHYVILFLELLDIIIGAGLWGIILSLSFLTGYILLYIYNITCLTASLLWKRVPPGLIIDIIHEYTVRYFSLVDSGSHMRGLRF